jgi:hypothetical protein
MLISGILNESPSAPSFWLSGGATNGLDTQLPHNSSHTSTPAKEDASLTPTKTQGDTQSSSGLEGTSRNQFMATDSIKQSTIDSKPSTDEKKTSLTSTK